MPARGGPWGGALGPLQDLIAVALLVAVLSRGQAFLVPVALAVFLAFVLQPLVHALERLRLPRIGAVGLVLGLALALVGGFGWVLTAQFRELAAHMPEYSSSIQGKLETLRFTRQGAIANIQKTVEEATREIERKDRDAANQPPTQRVTVVSAEPTDVARLRTIVMPVLGPLLEGGLVIVLVVFLLVQREDLRNRVIRLAGPGRLTLTTRTMDEAGQRISRYLLAQSAVNLGFGLTIAAGLLWIGVPYALLWGTAAALLRFAPYVGAPFAMVMPALIAAVKFEGWRRVFETVALFLGVDALTANFVEPVVIGQHVGVSSLALLLAAFFWAWLWGPVGLLLSTPLTLCLAVIGKHVPRLEYLAVVLGDEAALAPDVLVYQRLLASDEDEANEVIDHLLETEPVDAVFDGVLLPAVVRSATDHAAGQASDDDHTFVLRAASSMVDRLADTLPAPPAAPATPGAPLVLLVPARDAGDELAVEMLARMLREQPLRLHRLSTASLAAEIVQASRSADVAAVCIAALPPGGLTNARYLCKRLDAATPGVRILVLRPGPSQTVAGADVVGSLRAARDRLCALPAAPAVGTAASVPA
jgi:predicted PurR-regulated permease PerM